MDRNLGEVLSAGRTDDRISRRAGFATFDFFVVVDLLACRPDSRGGAGVVQTTGYLTMRGTFTGGTGTSLSASVAAAKDDPTVIALRVCHLPCYVGHLSDRGCQYRLAKLTDLW